MRGEGGVVMGKGGKEGGRVRRRGTKGEKEVKRRESEMTEKREVG